MDNSNIKPDQHGQVNPGQADGQGEEVTIRKNEGISDQGNEWSDEEGVHASSGEFLGEKAEKYIKDSANIEDLPGEDEQKEANKELEKNEQTDAQAATDQTDDVVESEDDYVPGFDLGRNKVQ